MGAALWELRAVLQKNLSHERMHRNIQRQKITLYPKNKIISGLRETSSFQNWTKPGIFPRIWKFPGFYRDSGKQKSWSVLFLVVIQERLQEQRISYWQKCEKFKDFQCFKWNIWGSENQRWFLRVCLSSSCQYCEHNNEFNQTHWQQLYCTIPGDKTN